MSKNKKNHIYTSKNKIQHTNKNNLNVENFSLIYADWLSCFKAESFDLIVSNPPYIADQDSHLEGLKHEPNKALIAKYGDQLSKIAEKNRVNLEFEASVCGGVPVIRSLKEGLIANKINRVYGIFNGTSNYILSTMDKENKTFIDVLTDAKKLGYAESNPF